MQNKLFKYCHTIAVKTTFPTFLHSHSDWGKHCWEDSRIVSTKTEALQIDGCIFCQLKLSLKPAQLHLLKEAEKYRSSCKEMEKNKRRMHHHQLFQMLPPENWKKSHLLLSFSLLLLNHLLLKKTLKNDSICLIFFSVGKTDQKEVVLGGAPTMTSWRDLIWTLPQPYRHWQSKKGKKPNLWSLWVSFERNQRNHSILLYNPLNLCLYDKFICIRRVWGHWVFFT